MSECFAFSLRKQRFVKTPSPIASGDYSASRLAANDWRVQLFQSWIKKEIDFSSFCDAVTAIPILPEDTLQGMLATLPVTSGILEQAISANTRRAIATSIEVTYINQSDAVTGLTIAVGALVFAISLSIWQPLLIISVITVFPFLQKWTKQCG
jgi:hypothetical protein